MADLLNMPILGFTVSHRNKVLLLTLMVFAALC